MTAAGICGSDMGIYHGTNAAATYPRIIGHEMVGVVEETGPEVKRLKQGDRVIINQVISCGTCYPCRMGRGNVCDHLQVRGVHTDGGYRDYIAVPEEDCYILPEGLKDTDAVMIEPTTIAIQSCIRAQLKEDDMLLILGAGIGKYDPENCPADLPLYYCGGHCGRKIGRGKSKWGGLYHQHSEGRFGRDGEAVYRRQGNYGIHRCGLHKGFPDEPVKGDGKCRAGDDHGIFYGSHGGKSIPDYIKRAGCERLPASEQDVWEGD